MRRCLAHKELLGGQGIGRPLGLRLPFKDAADAGGKYCKVGILIDLEIIAENIILCIARVRND